MPDGPWCNAWSTQLKHPQRLQLQYSSRSNRDSIQPHCSGHSISALSADHCSVTLHPAHILLRPDVSSTVLRMLHNEPTRHLDRKSTRLNSSHVKISYAVFCLKKKKNTTR